MHIDYKTLKPIIDKQIEMNKKAEEFKKKYGNFESIKRAGRRNVEKLGT